MNAQRPMKKDLANSTEQDETPQNMASNQDLHCLHKKTPNDSFYMFRLYMQILAKSANFHNAKCDFERSK